MRLSQTTVAASLVATALATVPRGRFALPAASNATASSTASSTPAATPTPSAEFYLRTKLKAGQTGKAAFDGLHVYSYHTGAGMSDAMLSANQSIARAAYTLGGSVPGAPSNTSAAAPTYFDVLFDVGPSSPPWHLQPQNTEQTSYAAWQPVRIDPGSTGPSSNSAFFFQDGTLQWTNEPGLNSSGMFGGWIVCQWWHPDATDKTLPGTQLFFRYEPYKTTVPSTCADVDLVPVYITSA